MRKDAVEHIAVSDRYKDRGIATQLLEESKKYGVRRVIGAISPEVAGIVHRFTVILSSGGAGVADTPYL